MDTIHNYSPEDLGLMNMTLCNLGIEVGFLPNGKYYIKDMDTGIALSYSTMEEFDVALDAIYAEKEGK